MSSHTVLGLLEKIEEYLLALLLVLITLSSIIHSVIMVILRNINISNKLLQFKVAYPNTSNIYFARKILISWHIVFLKIISKYKISKNFNNYEEEKLPVGHKRNGRWAPDKHHFSGIRINNIS